MHGINARGDMPLYNAQHMHALPQRRRTWVASEGSREDLLQRPLPPVAGGGHGRPPRRSASSDHLVQQQSVQQIMHQSVEQSKRQNVMPGQQSAPGPSSDPPQDGPQQMMGSVNEQSTIQGPQQVVGRANEPSTMQGPQQAMNAFDEQSMMQGPQQGMGGANEQSTTQGPRQVMDGFDERSVMRERLNGMRRPASAGRFNPMRASDPGSTLHPAESY